MPTAITRGEKDRDMTDNRRLNPVKKNRSKTSQPPVTRPGQNYPGGRAMRRALRRLGQAKASFVPTSHGVQRTMPGAMHV